MKLNEIERHVNETVILSNQLTGYLTEKEVRFLSILPFINIKGEILEIGSFEGKSTIILAKSVKASGDAKIFACDPLLLISSTDPVVDNKEEISTLFQENLRKHGVSDVVKFHQMKSSELAESWTLPLRILWIDGDHTYQGALQDFQLFQDSLVSGAVVCFHDVLHGFDGPIRVFMESILLSGSFGDCGLCGSIGWGQFIGEFSPTKKQWRRKLSLYRKLSRLIPYYLGRRNGLNMSKIILNLFRSLVPHGDINPVQWMEERNDWHKTAMDRRG